jgi:hypothetical protein
MGKDVRHCATANDQEPPPVVSNPNRTVWRLEGSRGQGGTLCGLDSDKSSG